MPKPQKKDPSGGLTMIAHSALKPFSLGVLATLSFGLLGFWWLGTAGTSLEVRVPIPANDPLLTPKQAETGDNPGTFTRGSGSPSDLPGSWPQFRGPGRDAIAADTEAPEGWLRTAPNVLWKIELGEGHAGAAVWGGCVYLLDYDEQKKEDVVRSLSLADAQEIWRYTYSSKVKRNHGMSRTIPAVNEQFLVTLGPKGQVHCFERTTGNLVWKKDLVADYGTQIPEWYAGQCPLIEGDRVILAPGGTKCLMTALELATGNPVWETPNDLAWNMTHGSISPVEFDGKTQYVWCASGGTVGVDSASGTLLWTYSDWTIKIANIPSPIDLGKGRILLTGGYNAGSTLLQIARAGEVFSATQAFHTEAEVFGSDQQTPIFAQGVVYGVIPSGRLACLSPEGKRLWLAEKDDFGLGPYLLLKDGKMLVLDDRGEGSGSLSLFRINPVEAEKLGSWKVLEGHDAWAPMAVAGDRVLLRDSKTLICVEIKGQEAL